MTSEQPTRPDVCPTPPSTNSKSKWWWRLGIVLLLMIAVGITVRWFRPPTDVSSSIHAVERGAPDANQSADAIDGSLLSRINQDIIDAADHPFDPLIEVAEASLVKTDQLVQDYTATLISQVRLDGKLQAEREIFCKIRHSRTSGDDQCGFSAYTRFVRPASSEGQEAIWVDGWNDGNLIAHTNILNFKRYYLSPNSWLAMRGSRHPITQIGFRNLLVKMLESGRRSRLLGPCQVEAKRNLQIGDRPCVMLQVTHPERKEKYKFYIARIFIDLELEIPLAFEGYLWPEKPDGEPILLEKYYYTDIKINSGLTDIDFDPANEAYEFPSQ